MSRANALKKLPAWFQEELEAAAAADTKDTWDLLGAGGDGDAVTDAERKEINRIISGVRTEAGTKGRKSAA